MFKYLTKCKVIFLDNQGYLNVGCILKNTDEFFLISFNMMMEL